MMHVEYHKGYPCVYKPILCQEGYCSDCAVYLEKSRGRAWVNEETDMVDLSKVKRAKFAVSAHEPAVVV